MGKTALMARLRAAAETHGIATVHVEVSSNTEAAATSARQALLGAAQQLAGGRQLRELARRLTGIRLGPAGVQLAATSGEPAPLHSLVMDLGQLAAEVDRPVFLTVDEAREGPTLAGQFVTGMHAAIQNERPLGMYLAGLPGTQREIADVVSYAERVVVDVLDPLDELGVAEALTRPFADHEITLDPRVAQAVHQDTAGYPDFVQVWGAALWDRAADPARVGLDDFERARPATQRTMRAFLERRWARFTPAQQGYLAAVAGAGDDTPRTAQVAEQLGKRPSDVTYLRDTLVAEGALYVPARGRIGFVIPPLAQLARSQARDQPWSR